MDRVPSFYIQLKQFFCLAVVAWSVKASNSHSVEVCTSALGGSNPAWGDYTSYKHVLCLIQIWQLFIIPRYPVTILVTAFTKTKKFD